MNNQNLNVVFTTTSLTESEPLISSMQSGLPDYTLHFAVLLIGQGDKELLSSSMLNPHVIARYKDYLPIHESRNICQSYLQQSMRDNQGIGLIVDDDLIWNAAQSDFTRIVYELTETHCDMAFSALAGDAPIPKEYTRASTLLDLLLSIQEQQGLAINSPISHFCNQISTTTVSSNDGINNHHDYYSFTKSCFRRVPVDINTVDWQSTVRRLSLGKSITRPVRGNPIITEATGRERGGATLILNPDVLNLKNYAMQCGDFTSRRSDMLMATDAKAAGFSLRNTPALLAHERQETFDSHDVRKLIGDILGYALVEAKIGLQRFSATTFRQSFSERVTRTQSVVQDTTTMLCTLSNWLIQNHLADRTVVQAMKSMVQENEETLAALHTLNHEAIFRYFSLFSDYYDQDHLGTAHSVERSLTMQDWRTDCDPAIQQVSVPKAEKAMG